jgi:uncharacterized membrane protein YczE
LDSTSQQDVLVYQRWLGITALAYVVAHHLGLLPGGLGSAPGGTQWADWLQLFVPVIVLAPAAMVMVAADSPARQWVLFGIGSVVYASGQGIHLAANSVNNARPGQTAHLWDEIVGHLIWYLGTALVLLALARTMPGRPRCGLIGYACALVVGLTWASNAVGGHTEVLSLAVALVAAWFGWRHRRELGETLLVGFLPSAVVLVVVLTPLA